MEKATESGKKGKQSVEYRIQEGGGRGGGGRRIQETKRISAWTDVPSIGPGRFDKSYHSLFYELGSERTSERSEQCGASE